MKALKSVVSLKSAASEKSRSRGTSAVSFKNDDLKFEDIIPSTCAKFCCPYDVVVKREIIREDSPKLSMLKASPRQKRVTTLSARSSEAKVVYPQTTVVVQAVFDRLLHLVEVSIHQQCAIPRSLLQVIALYAPFFEELTKIHIRRCPIDVYTIHELNKMLHISYITEILLEDTPVPEGNYAILLGSSNLRNLSLHRCKINDEVCKEIAARLHGAEQYIHLLSLASNHISDTGAHHLGNALRTNRKLVYLNLSDNRITDTGADYLLDILCEFPLTYDEQVGMRTRYLKYLQQKQIIYQQFMDNFTQDRSLTDSSSSKQSRSTEKIHSRTTIRSESTPSPLSAQSRKDKAENRASELLGPFVDPFAGDLVTVKNGWTYCNGNLTLCSLNLGYNQLSYITTKKILHVLTHQNRVRKKNQQGLVRIVIEGNPMPETCVEMANISNIIDSYLSRVTTNETRKSRKSRAATLASLQTRKHNLRTDGSL